MGRHYLINSFSNTTVVRLIPELYQFRIIKLVSTSKVTPATRPYILMTM